MINRTCQQCKRPAWFKDENGNYLCPTHARVTVRDGISSRAEMPVWNVTQAQEKDKKIVRDLWQHFWDDDQMDCFGRDYHVDRIPALIARSEGEVGGSASYMVEPELDAVNIVSLVTIPDAQGKGAGTAMVTALERIASREGVSRLVVATSNDNVLALAFYQRLGFTITGIKVGAIAPDDDGDHEQGIGSISVRDEIQLELRLKTRGSVGYG